MWPLAESAVLKKRFDEIFAAEKYTKALDTLKSLRKTMMQDQKVEDEKLAGLKDKRELAMRLQADIRTSEERITLGESKIASLDKEIEESNGKISELQKELEILSSLQGDFERLQHEHQMAVQQHGDLASNITLMIEDDGEIEGMLAKHEEHVRDAEAARERLVSERSETATEILQLERRQGNLLSERGKLWAEKEQQDRRGKELYALLREISVLLDLPFGERSIFMDSARRKIGVLQASFSRLQQDNQDIDSKAIEQIQSVVGEQNRLTEIKRSTRKAVDEARGKLCSVIDELDAVKSSLSRLEELKKRVEEDENALKAAKEGMESSVYEQKLAALNAERKGVEEELSKITEAISKLSKSADIRARLEVKRADVGRKESLLERVWSDVQYDLKEASGYLPEREDAEKEVDIAQRSRDREVRALQERVDAARSSFKMAESRLDHLKMTMEKKERELADKRRRVEAVCGKDDFGYALEEAEEGLAAVSKELGFSQNSRSTYESFQSQLGKRHECPLCDRGFPSASEEEALQQKLQQFLASLPETVMAAEQKRRTLERRLQELRELRPAHDDMERLRLREIPDLAGELKAAEEEKVKTRMQAEDLSSELSTLVLGEKRLSLLKKRCEEVSRAFVDARSGREELGRLEEEFSLQGQSDTRSAGELEESSKSLQSRLSALQAAAEEVSREARQRQASVQSAEFRWRDSKERLMQVQLRASEAIRLEQAKEETEMSIQKMEAELSDLARNLEPLMGRVEELKARREASRMEASAKEKREREIIDGYLQKMNQAETLVRETSSSSKTSEILSSLEAELATVEGKILSIRDRMAQLDAELSAEGKSSGELQMRERCLKDNLMLRSLARRITDLSGKLDSMPKVSGASRQETMDRLLSAQTVHSELLGSRAGLLGELRQLQDQVFRQSQDLSTNFPDYQATYRKQVVRVTACSAAIDDLERYAKALDQAIMRYHGHKMDELNRLIRELWMATYQGADIDTIEIRAAHAAEGAGARTYNYRVVMVKGEGELDMRGRSSAGQRVLASLIIRLALAETFGQSCGILALDEPTTNLDRDNIEALAAALADIIRARRQQANFQLVIITHDEEFVEMLGRQECADHYYRVFKDEGQFSTIEQQTFQGAALR